MMQQLQQHSAQPQLLGSGAGGQSGRRLRHTHRPAPHHTSSSSSSTCSSSSSRHALSTPACRQLTPAARLLAPRAAATAAPTAAPAQQQHQQVQQQLAPPQHGAAAMNQHVREGHYEAPLVQEQASKRDSDQPSLASLLPALAPGATVDVVVAGCGPAGLALAAELAKRGLSVGLIGPDGPFVNNYGVWVDEFEALRLLGTLERTYADAACFFAEARQTRVGRAYGRVCRRKLRAALVAAAAAAGGASSGSVAYLPAAVEGVVVAADGATATVSCSGGASITSRLVTLASGQAAGRLLAYEADAPAVAAQTAYGIEAEVEGYPEAYDVNSMLFMDYRRHHSGLWDGAARHLEPGNHPNAGEGLWGSSEEVPSFLYAMPVGPAPSADATAATTSSSTSSTPTTTSRVFLEETCLVAKPALPFATLKRRLTRRLAAMGVRVVKVHEEEWSYIPVGGPLPIRSQPLTAFGAAANLVHPATGFSVSRSLRQAPEMADAIVAALAADGGVLAASEAVWDALWSQERRQQAAFHVFGMELLTQLDLSATNDFFNTFFSLPSFYWRGFLGSNLSAAQLLVFALLTFAIAPLSIKGRLVGHLLGDPAGKYLIKRYLGQDQQQQQEPGPDSSSSSSSSSAAAAAAVATGTLPAATAAEP